MKLSQLNWYLFSFKGRINRKSFWLSYFIMLILVIILGSILGLLDAYAYLNNDFGSFIVLAYVFAMFLTIWMNAAICAKRWHDSDCSGWWSLLVFIPAVGLIALIICGIRTGSVEGNKYGSETNSF